MISDLNVPVPIKTTSRNLVTNRTTSFATTFFLPAANGAIIYGIDAVFSINHSNYALGAPTGVGTDSFIEIGYGSVYIPVKRAVSVSSARLPALDFLIQREILTLEKPVILPAGVGFGFGVFPNNMDNPSVSAKVFVNYELL